MFTETLSASMAIYQVVPAGSAQKFSAPSSSSVTVTGEPEEVGATPAGAAPEAGQSVLVFLSLPMPSMLSAAVS